MQQQQKLQITKQFKSNFQGLFDKYDKKRQDNIYLSYFI